MDNEHTIRTIIVDDHPLYRVGLKMVLRYSNANCEVVAEAESVRQALDYLTAHAHELDLLMLDFFLPDGTALDVLQFMETHCPEMKVLLISGETMPPTVLRMVEDRIDGFISKKVKPEEMKQRIDALFGAPSNPHDADEIWPDGLSEREVEVIRLCAKGLTAKEIADKLFIGKRTVETHKERIFVKLDLKSTKELINYAFRSGLME